MSVPVLAAADSFAVYPVYDVQVALSEGGATIGFLVANSNSGASDPVSGNGTVGLFDSTTLEASFLTAVKSWAEGADWSSFDGGTYAGITITKLTQASANVTP